MKLIDGIPVWGEPLQDAVDQMKKPILYSIIALGLVFNSEAKFSSGGGGFRCSSSSIKSGFSFKASPPGTFKSTASESKPSFSTGVAAKASASYQGQSAPTRYYYPSYSAIYHGPIYHYDSGSSFLMNYLMYSTIFNSMNHPTYSMMPQTNDWSSGQLDTSATPKRDDDTAINVLTMILIIVAVFGIFAALVIL